MIGFERICEGGRVIYRIIGIAAGIIGLILIGWGLLKETGDLMTSVTYYFVWILGVVFLGLAQVWDGVRYAYYHEAPKTIAQGLWESLEDGNLFIFSISVAGTVFASSAGLLLRPSSGASGHKTAIAVMLLSVTFVLVFVATPAWTNFRHRTKTEIKQTPIPAGQKSTYPPDRAIQLSIQCASVAVICALLAEILLK